MPRGASRGTSASALVRLGTRTSGQHAGDGALIFRGVDRSRVCRCVRLPGSWGSDRRGLRRAGRRGFVSRPLDGKSVLSGAQGQSGSWADLGQRRRPATTRGVRPRFVVCIRSALPLVWYFLGRVTASVMPSRGGGEFRRSGRGQDTKHKNRFDLRVADFHRASQSRSIFSAHEFDVVPSTGRSWEGGGERQALGRSVVFWVDHKR
jgi:hypothetical protein